MKQDNIMLKKKNPLLSWLLTKILTYVTNDFFFVCFCSVQWTFQRFNAVLYFNGLCVQISHTQL